MAISISSTFPSNTSIKGILLFSLPVVCACLPLHCLGCRFGRSSQSLMMSSVGLTNQVCGPSLDKVIKCGIPGLSVFIKTSVMTVSPLLQMASVLVQCVISMVLWPAVSCHLKTTGSRRLFVPVLNRPWVAEWCISPCSQLLTQTLWSTGPTGKAWGTISRTCLFSFSL